MGRGGGLVGWWVVSAIGKGVQNPDGLVTLRYQNQTLLSI